MGHQCGRRVLSLLWGKRVMIIDLDAHQGNGHETNFANDSQVYILDMYNPGIYPFDYEARRFIDQRVEVASGTTTAEYLRKLDEALELILYNAGTDILHGDALGLKSSMEEKRKLQMSCLELRLPISFHKSDLIF